MGINNRQRRRAKQQRRRRADNAGSARRATRPDWGPDPFDEQAVRGAVLAAAEAYRFESPVTYQSRLRAVAAVEDVVGSAAVDGASPGGSSGPSTGRGGRDGSRPTWCGPSGAR